MLAQTHPAPISAPLVAPLLRETASAAAVSAIAVIAAENALAAVHWVAKTWGPDADFRDPGHSSHASVVEPGSPTRRFADALDLLVSECRRYTADLGLDGVAHARDVIERHYNAHTADLVLDTLEKSRERIYALGISEAATMPRPKRLPTPAERRAGQLEVLRRLFAEPPFAVLEAPLEALLRAFRSPGAAPDDPAVLATLPAIKDAIHQAFDQGADEGLVQNVLSMWTQATGGPIISVSPPG